MGDTFLKKLIKTIIELTSGTLGHLYKRNEKKYKRNENINSHKNLYTNKHNSFISASKLEITSK
jgi:hypothetical protein